MGRLNQARSALARSKPLLVARNLRHYRSLRANRSRYRRLGISRSVVRPIAHRHIAREASDGPWLDAPGADERLASDPRFERLPEATRRQLERWPTDGYVVLEGLFGADLIGRVNADLDALLDDGDLSFHRGGPRVRNAYRRSPAVAEALNDPRLLEILGLLLGRPVSLFQSISFFQGSEQHAHSDAFHMTTEPQGYLVAIWVALEDVTPDCGPLFYLPGSHRLPAVMTEDLEIEDPAPSFVAEKNRAYDRKMQQIVAECGIEPREFVAKRGDVLVWHSNLLHGGRPIARQGSTRRSLVAHFFAEDVLRYHEVTERPAYV